MIWSLLRIMIFLAALVALAFGLTLLAQAETALRLSFAGWELTLHPLQIAMESLIWQETLKSPIVKLGSQRGFDTNIGELVRAA